MNSFTVSVFNKNTLVRKVYEYDAVNPSLVRTIVGEMESIIRFIRHTVGEGTPFSIEGSINDAPNKSLPRCVGKFDNLAMSENLATMLLGHQPPTQAIVEVYWNNQKWLSRPDVLTVTDFEKRLVNQLDGYPAEDGCKGNKLVLCRRDTLENNLSHDITIHDISKTSADNIFAKVRDLLYI